MTFLPAGVSFYYLLLRKRKPHLKDYEGGRTSREGVRLAPLLPLIALYYTVFTAKRPTNEGKGPLTRAQGDFFIVNLLYNAITGKSSAPLPHERSSLICSPPCEDRLFLGVIDHILQ